MIVFNFYACMFWLFGTKHWGGGGGGGGGGRGGMGSPNPSPCHVPKSYGQLCLSRQKLMHVLNEDTHFDLY